MPAPESEMTAIEGALMDGFPDIARRYFKEALAAAHAKGMEEAARICFEEEERSQRENGFGATPGMINRAIRSRIKDA